MGVEPPPRWLLPLHLQHKRRGVGAVTWVRVLEETVVGQCSEPGGRTGRRGRGRGPGAASHGLLVRHLVHAWGQVPTTEHHRVEVDELPVSRHPLGAVALAVVLAVQRVLPPSYLRLEARHPAAILGREPHRA